MNNTLITIETLIEAEIADVWKCWTTPSDIMEWNFASDDWHCPAVENDPQPDGILKWRMAAKDGSFAFDFEGKYVQVIPESLLEYTLADGRKVIVEFSGSDGKTRVVESFEPESENPFELQRMGWQSILNNFRKYVENHADLSE